MKKEFFAFTIVFIILVLFPASLFAYQTWRSNASDARVIDLVGHSPASGAWQPDTIRVNVGEHVRLRISSTDTVHGFEIPALDVKIDEILPGHVEEVEFTAAQAGRFPFACTRWCSADHWRMRGTIEVVDPVGPNPYPTSAPPLFQQMKIDLDALHPAQHVPPQRPSATRGALIQLAISEDLRTQSPSEVFTKLRGRSTFQSYDDQQLWDAIAFAYERSAGEDAIARGQHLFARDCAACHGEGGKGNGPAGLKLPGRTAMHAGADASHPVAEMKKGPADLTDASQMLGASDVLLQGKILRGGMGTGMPEWGSLYTEQEMWDVVSFIRSFTFDYASKYESSKK